MAMGRPTKFTKEVDDIIISEIKKGYTDTVACAKAGVSKRTFYRWQNKAESQKTKTDLKCFFEELEIAKGLRQALYEDVTRNDALENGNPQTAKWYLAHIDPDTWGNQDNNNSSANDLEEYIDPAEEDKIFSGVEYE